MHLQWSPCANMMARNVVSRTDVSRTSHTHSNTVASARILYSDVPIGLDSLLTTSSAPSELAIRRTGCLHLALLNSLVSCHLSGAAWRQGF